MKQDTKKTLAPGSYSSGTLKPEDTVPMMLALLRERSPEVAAEVEREWGVATRNSDDEYKQELSCVLIDLLDEFCPENHYFGGHEGDPADLGVWAYDEYSPKDEEGSWSNVLTVSQKGKHCGEIRKHFRGLPEREITDDLRARAESELRADPQHQSGYYDLLLVDCNGAELDFETHCL